MQFQNHGLTVLRACRVTQLCGLESGPSDRPLDTGTLLERCFSQQMWTQKSESDSLSTSWVTMWSTRTPPLPSSHLTQCKSVGLDLGLWTANTTGQNKPPASVCSLSQVFFYTDKKWSETPWKLYILHTSLPQCTICSTLQQIQRLIKINNTKVSVE